MPEKYNIVLSGRHPAADPHQVALKLAALFKCTAEQAGHLLSQPSCVVKRVVAADVADKYKKAIENTGAQCIIQPIPQEASLDFDVVPVSSAPAVPVSSSPSISTGGYAPPVSPVAVARAPQAPAATSAPAVRERASTASVLSRQEAIQIFVGKNHGYFERKWAGGHPLTFVVVRMNPILAPEWFNW